jgi:hypothetical protein
MGKRPLSVWIVLILLSLGAMGVAYGSADFYFSGGIGRQDVPSGSDFTSIVMGRVVLAGLITWTVVAVARRQAGGRTGAMLLIALVSGFFIFANEYHPPQYANKAESFEADLIVFLVFVFSATLLFRFGFGKNSRRYFRRY